jgi:hypothetical protein
MKREKIEGFLAGICTAISSCVIVSRKFSDGALDDEPDERGPALGLALGAVKCAAALIDVLEGSIVELALGNELSMYGFDKDSVETDVVNIFDPPKDVQ